MWKLIVGRDSGPRYRYVMSWCYLDFIFDLSPSKSCLDYILETVKCRKLMFCRDIGEGGLS